MTILFPSLGIYGSKEADEDLGAGTGRADATPHPSASAARCARPYRPSRKGTCPR